VKKRRGVVTAVKKKARSRPPVGRKGPVSVWAGRSVVSNHRTPNGKKSEGTTPWCWGTGHAAAQADRAGTETVRAAGTRDKKTEFPRRVKKETGGKIPIREGRV